MRIKLISLLLLAGTSVQSEAVSTDNLAESLQKCNQVQNDYGRLVCYDSLSKAQQEIIKDETNQNDSTQGLVENTYAPVTAKQLPVLIADIDEPGLMYSLGRMDVLGNEFDAMLIGLGHRHNIFNFNRPRNHSLHLNLMGHIRAQFDVDEISDRNNRGGALINTDFIVGGELVQTRENWQWRLAYTHRSTHLGDEFLIENQEYLTRRTNLSYEKIDFLALKSINNWDIYAAAAFITRIEPGYLDKFQFQAGWQFKGENIGPGRPIIAMDFKSWEAADRPINITFRAGLEFDRWLNRPFKVLFEYQEGHSPYGQFFTEDFSYFGLSLYSHW